MNAIDFLIKEHNHVRKALLDISDNSHRIKTKLKKFDVLCQELLRHETMEHKVWYPRFKNRLSKRVNHLLMEEKAAERAIEKFNQIATAKTWEEKFHKFKQEVEHHAAEEEQKLFPEVKMLLDNAELENIGKKMYLFKKEHPIC